MCSQFRLKRPRPLQSVSLDFVSCGLGRVSNGSLKTAVAAFVAPHIGHESSEVGSSTSIDHSAPSFGQRYQFRNRVDTGNSGSTGGDVIRFDVASSLASSTSVLRSLSGLVSVDSQIINRPIVRTNSPSLSSTDGGSISIRRFGRDE